MKAKVIRTFIDKNTRKQCNQGIVISIDQKRFDEINSTVAGVLVEKIEEKKAAEK